MGFGFLIMHVYLNPMSHQLLTKEKPTLSRCLEERKKTNYQNKEKLIEIKPN